MPSTFRSSAKGVEDRVALDWLGEIGCDIGQGFHIARPLPLAELREWLASLNGTGWQLDAAPATAG